MLRTMKADTMSTRTYDAKVVMCRYMNLVAIILLIGFLVCWANDLTSGAYYFLAATIGHMAFVVTKAWFAEREFFGRTGPIDRVFSCNTNVPTAEATVHKS